MHFLGTCERKASFPLFPELFSSPRHWLPRSGWGEPHLPVSPTALCPCFMQRCEQLATKPWGSGAFVFQVLFSAFFSLPSWLLGRVIFSPPLPVSASAGCALCFSHARHPCWEKVNFPKEWLANAGSGVREGLELSRSSLLSFCSDLLKKSCITRQKI